jgi:methylenetetrahydrofolate dehydrogenase (NADP+) / methenyltetrahydrofolate cyclohydrolase
MAVILDGRAVATKIKDDLRSRISKVKPLLAVCLVGSDPASEIYVNHKRKACEELGIDHQFQHFTADCTTEQIIDWLQLNSLDEPHGILVQLPLPAHLDKDLIIQSIDPRKDVDCFHPENQGLLMLGQPRFLPCTPAGILEMLHYYSIALEGQHVVIVNSSIIVGKPLAMMLVNARATVTVCHEYTRDLQSICLTADIIVTAVGKEHYRLTADMVKKGQVIIDVGIFREGRKIRGDAVFEEVAQKVGFISPCPNGVGPLTVGCLLKNTVQACESLSK